jgi:hypothetical protein
MYCLLNFTSPYTSGQKLLEQLYNLGVKPFLFLSLLDDSKADSDLHGSWIGDRVVLIGDYAETFPFLAPSEVELNSGRTEEFKEVGMGLHKKWLKNVEKLGSLLDYYVINTTKNEYLPVSKFETSTDPNVVLHNRDGIMKAVFSTLFHSDEVAGGDSEHLIDGRWAGDRLVISKTLPSKCLEITDKVKELLKTVDEEDG